MHTELLEARRTAYLGRAQPAERTRASKLMAGMRKGRTARIGEVEAELREVQDDVKWWKQEVLSTKKDILAHFTRIEQVERDAVYLGYDLATVEEQTEPVRDALTKSVAVTL